ncbi:MAG: DUF6020 family protein [Clostridiales bacterium]|nr:DUF6020 family protein [Clostridiales bacterium]
MKKISACPGKRILWKFLQFILMFSWMCILVNCIEEYAAYYTVYLFVGVLGVLAFYRDTRSHPRSTRRQEIALHICAGIFSCAVILANYSLFSGEHWAFSGIRIFVTFLGGGLIAYYILRWILVSKKDFCWKTEAHRRRPAAIFGGCMLVILVIDLAVFLTCFYLGVLNPDSVNQLNQISSGEYSNHHPYYYTLLIRVLLRAGLFLFSEINQAVAFYSVVQIIIMAAVFSYVVMTLYQREASKKWLILCLAWYALHPAHIMYSFTMWKDTLFGAAVLLLITAWYRILAGMDSGKKCNLLLFFAGGFGVCLFRSNGIVAFAVLFCVCAVLFWKQHKRLIASLLFILIAGFVLRGPVLSALNVSQPDIVESLSIPVQQISRVVADKKALTEEEEELLEQVVDVDEISETYDMFISDPIKNLIRESGNEAYISTHKIQYLKLWVSLGIRYPSTYVKAWIDQTKGYWNGGYDYWVWGTEIYENSFGIQQSGGSDFCRHVWDVYGELYESSESISIFNLFVSIGLMTWVYAALFAAALMRGRRIAFSLGILPLAVILTLLIATPVFSEFRYAYCLYTAIPVVFYAVFEAAPEERGREKQMRPRCGRKENAANDQDNTGD